MNDVIVYRFRRGFWYDLLNVIVSILTLSKYSHAELYVDGYSYTSTMKNGVCRFKGKRRHGKWDEIDYNATKEEKEIIKNFYIQTMHCNYDWVGTILWAWLPFSIHAENRFYCFEWIMAATKQIKYFPYPTNLRGSTLYKFIRSARLDQLNRMLKNDH